MPINDEFDDFIERIAPRTNAEKQEVLLRYFAALIEGMGDVELRMLREDFAQRFPEGPEQDTIFEVIDGHFALRDLKG